MSLGAKLTVHVPSAATVAARDTWPSWTITVEPGSTVPVITMPCAASAAFTTPSLPPVWPVKARLLTKVSTSTWPVAVAVLPAASVATAVTVAVVSPVGISEAAKSADQLPFASTTASRVTPPKVT